MGTRAVITFKDKDGESFHVYQHHDSFPENIESNIKEAKQYAWELPRFEASDFAAAYIRAMKHQAGNIRVSNGPEYHGDLAYSYRVTYDNGKIKVVTTSSP